jgi:ribulose-phosphate 3-epimerase
MICSGDFSRLGEETRALVEAGADMVHVDVMDGHFTPGITIGAAAVASLRQYCSAPLDVHLLTEEPQRHAADFADVGADILSFHIETARHPTRLIREIKDLGMKAGIVLNPGSSEDEIEFLLSDLDMVTVMTVNPGFGEYRFIEEMTRKIKNIRAMIGDRDLAVEGGIDMRTAPMAVEAGANILNVSDCIFRSDSYMAMIDSLRAAAK